MYDSIPIPTTRFDQVRLACTRQETCLHQVFELAYCISAQLDILYLRKWKYWKHCQNFFYRRNCHKVKGDNHV